MSLGSKIAVNVQLPTYEEKFGHKKKIDDSLNAEMPDGISYEEIGKLFRSIPKIRNKKLNQ